MRVDAVQRYMREQRIDAWMVYDFRESNAVMAQVLPGERHTTRRSALVIPAEGEVRLGCSVLDVNQFSRVGVKAETYVGWKEWEAWVRGALAGKSRVAMEYSPGGALPVMGVVDAGTVEWVRSLGVEVVSSANAVQACVAAWDEGVVAEHDRVSGVVAGIKDEAFGLIASRQKAGKRVDERGVQQFILRRFEEEGLETPDPPIVGANAHSGDPHFEVAADGSSEIKPGDWVLIDLWARKPGREHIYADITWVGCCGREVPGTHREVFEVVLRARDASLRLAQERWAEKRAVQGWELDEAAREEIVRGGYAHGIKHRTGHSLSAGTKVHGIGMNLDNLETRDTREMMAGIGFTIEPGVYLEGFGVRLEINVYVDPAKGPRVTSCLQEEVVLMG